MARATVPSAGADAAVVPRAANNLVTSGGWLVVVLSLLGGLLRLKRRTATPQVEFVCCAVDTDTKVETDTKREADTKADGSAPSDLDEDLDFMQGARWDPGMQIWRKADKFKSTVKVTPLSGLPYIVWPAMHKRLVEWGLKSVSCKEALELMEGGAVLLDVRAATDAARNKPKGGINVPLFQPVQGREFWDNVKRFTMLLYGMGATEQNPNFVDDVLKAGIKKDDKIIVACPIGGTLETEVKVPGRKPTPTPERSFGRESRSMKACYLLMRAGFTDIIHLDGGLSQWYHEGHPVEELE